MSGVTLLGPDDLVWPFHQANSGPVYLLRSDADAYPSRTPVDPFPCYAHDAELVAQLLAEAYAAFPLDPAPHVFVLSHEPHARTNGWAESKQAYDEDAEGWVPAAGQIVLAGKRIPPHPAVTRYLVAHEYGHHVQYQLERDRGEQAGSGELEREYAHLRGLDTGIPYGGGTWHITPGELLANDFRVLVAQAEVEFWPHPGLPRPEEVPAVRDFWEQAVARNRQRVKAA